MTLQFANDFMLITNEIYLNGLKGPEEAQYLGSQRAQNGNGIDRKGPC